MGEYVSSNMRIFQRLEILSFILIVFLIVGGTFGLIAWHRMIPLLSNKCGPSFSEFGIILSDAVLNSDGSYSSHQVGLKFLPGQFWKSNGTVYGCPCSVKPCIRKCCAEEEEYYYHNESFPIVCKKSRSSLFHPLSRDVYFALNRYETVGDLRKKPIEDNYFSFLHGDICKYGKFVRNKTEDILDEDFLLDDGRVISMNGNIMDQSQYCMESIGTDIYTMECISEEDFEKVDQEQRDTWMTYLIPICMVVSEPFLVVTLAAYVLVPQKNNLHKRFLLSHATSLLFGYGGLAYINIAKEHSNISCYVTAFIVQYFLLSCFYWLNVMCFDIWWTFSGLRLLRGSQGDSQHKKFLLYSVYAWGMPLVITSATLAMDLIPGIPEHYIKPGIIGIDRCWFNGNEPRMVYFYLPMGVLVSLNMLMFSTTAYRIRSNDRSCNVLKNKDSKRHNADKKRFNIYLKLFVVMGISWVLEIVSFLLGDSPYIWLASDVCNSLQGPLIFFLFVCNHKILYSLNMKLCPSLAIIKPPLQNRNNTVSSPMCSSASVKNSDPHPL